MGLLQDCEVYFHTRDLYEVLNVPKTADSKTVKQAYYKLSLLVHPDRVKEEEKDNATAKFQVLSKIYVVLCDEDKRKIYDETGDVDDEDSLPEDKNWEQYWRLLFPKITGKDIEEFLEKYRGSEEEIDDLKHYYKLYEGDMDLLAECVIGFDIHDEKRYVGLLNDLIERGEIPAFDAFTKETVAKKQKRRRKYMKEARQAAAMKRSLKGESEDDLVKALTKRRGERESAFNDLMSNLEAKYCTGGKKKNSKMKEARRAEASKSSHTGESEDDLVKTLTKKRGERESAFNDLISNLEAKYCAGGKKNNPKRKKK